MTKHTYITISILLIFLLPSVLSDNYTYGDSFKPNNNNVTYFVPVTNMVVDNLSLGNICLNLTGGTFEYDHCTIYNDPINLTLCGFDSDCPIDYECSTKKVCIETVIGITGYVPAYISGDIAKALFNIFVKILIFISSFIILIIFFWIYKYWKRKN